MQCGNGREEDIGEVGVVCLLKSGCLRDGQNPGLD